MVEERGIGEAMPVGCFEVKGLPACSLWSRIYLRPGVKTRLSVCEEFSEGWLYAVRKRPRPSSL